MAPLLPTPRRELLAAGASPQVLAQDIRSGRSVSVFRGVHAAAPHATGFLVRCHAALAAQDPHAMLGHTTAAAGLRLRWSPPEWAAEDATIHLAVRPTAYRRHRPGLRLHWRSIPESQVVTVDGLRCMSPTRTVIELARDPTLPRLLVVQVIDGALRDRRTSVEQLLECLGGLGGERYVARARRLVLEARDGVDSPKETELRLLLTDGGITELDVGIEIRDDSGLLVARGDLGVRRLLLWGEYDGFDPHTERTVFRGDRVGDRWLQRRGWQPMRFVDEDLRRPEATCRELRAAVAAAPARIAALDPRRSPEVADAQRALGLLR